MEWFKFTLLFIKQKLSIIGLIILIAFSALIYEFSIMPNELLGIIISPLFTLLVLTILEEYKSKWNSKYEAFKILYSNRGNILEDESVKCLNSIDILFVDDKNVRECWKKLFDTYIKGAELSLLANKENNDKIMPLLQETYKERDIRLVELLNSMAISLGLNRDISYHNISQSYTPSGYGNGRTITKLEYYKAGTTFFQSQLPRDYQTINNKDISPMSEV